MQVSLLYNVDYNKWSLRESIRVHLRWISRIPWHFDGCDRSKRIVRMLLRRSLSVFLRYLSRFFLMWFTVYSAPTHSRVYWLLVRAYLDRIFFLRVLSSSNSWLSSDHRVRALPKTSWPWMIWIRGAQMSWTVLHIFHTLFCVVPISHPL